MILLYFYLVQAKHLKFLKQSDIMLTYNMYVTIIVFFNVS